MARKNREQTVQVAFRLERTIVDRLERHAERMARENPGLAFSRVDAGRVLLTSALAVAEAKDPRKKS